MTEIQKIKIRRNRKNKGIGNKNRLGKIPWNKDKKGLQSAWNKGITPSKETSKKMELLYQKKHIKSFTRFMAKEIIPKSN